MGENAWRRNRSGDSDGDPRAARRAPLLGWWVVLLVLASLGCEGTKRSGTLHRDQHLEHDGVTRQYHFYQSDHEGPRPLVLVLHGGGGNIDALFKLSGLRSPHQVWLDVAEEEGVHVVAPQGLGGHWNDCRRACQRCGDADDVGFLHALVDALSAAYSVDASRIYAVGESNGGFMVQRLAQETPGRFAALGVINAQLPRDNACSPVGEAVALMYQLGTDDPAIAYDGSPSNDPALVVTSAAETLAYWRGVNVCTDAAAEQAYPDRDPDDGSTATVAHFTCSGAPLAVITVDGGGHVPSSIAVRVTWAWEALVGPQNHDFESARELWAFFAAQRI